MPLPHHLLTALVLILLLVFPRASSAGLFENTREELQGILSKPDISLDGYNLPQQDLSLLYAKLAYKPAWNFQGADNAAAFQNFLSSLETLISYHGLSPNAYPLELTRRWHDSAESGASLKTELLISSMLLRLARDLHGDSVNLHHLYPGWTLRREPMDIPAQLASAIESNRISQFLNTLAPTRKEYTDLTHILSDLRSLKEKGEPPQISSGASLRLGDQGDRVFQLRQRLEAEQMIAPLPAPATDANVFDVALENALKIYQDRHGLDTDGRAGKQTQELLNRSLDQRILTVRANMERWRHIPESFPAKSHAVINIPAMSITVAKENGRTYSGPVIVGRVDRKTPFIDSTIHHMIVNPTWHVPAKIARKDILPKLRKNPNYLEELGFTIKNSADDPHGESIDWDNISDQAFRFQLRQAPGAHNSLGRLKFDFKNDFAVYMHGTPHQELFSKNDRALSSGCVRLRDPVDVAEVVFSDSSPPYTATQLNAMIDQNKTKWLTPTTALPITFLYWTVFRDADGHVKSLKDIYNYDRILIDVLDR